MVYIWLIIGFICLVGGANFFVEGASGVARKLNVPSVVIGLTVVAFGTSAPEAAVSIDAALKGSNAIALNNVIGSNIFNIIFILAFSSVLNPIGADVVAVYDTFFLLCATLMVYILAKNDGEISKKEGLAMVIAYIAYTVFIILR